MTKKLSLHGRLRMAAACPDANAPLLAEAADAIEAHDAFKQEVSDAVETLITNYPRSFLREHLGCFIVAKPDPLVEVMDDLGWDIDVAIDYAKDLRAALEARGLEIREKGQ